ncbi:hypothetical protein RRG08_008258 [Elysia crispata]|uniref:Uncharacterized protein n=1 Tax=Elysia crispata TaxID=231223 RepID=A0AAE1DJF1_9GAST|nr:hypothetical protein RRG08_008258 [Elysia crispata]
MRIGSTLTVKTIGETVGSWLNEKTTGLRTVSTFTLRKNFHDRSLLLTQVLLLGQPTPELGLTPDELTGGISGKRQRVEVFKPSTTAPVLS